MSDDRKPVSESPGQGKKKSAAAALGKLATALGLKVLARWIYEKAEEVGLI